MLTKWIISDVFFFPFLSLLDVTVIGVQLSLNGWGQGSQILHSAGGDPCIRKLALSYLQLSHTPQVTNVMKSAAFAEYNSYVGRTHAVH